MVFIGTSLCSLFVAGGVAPKSVSLEEPFSSSNEPERGSFPAKAGRLKYVDMKKADVWSNQTGLPLLSVGTTTHQLMNESIAVKAQFV